MERWRKPVIPDAVADLPEDVSFEAGRPTQELRVRHSPETIARMKLGYVCVRCWEPHEEAFPVRCSVCQFPMRAEQAAEFHSNFVGAERNPRAVRIEKGLDDLDDRHERNFHVNKLGIIVPYSLKE